MLAELQNCGHSNQGGFRRPALEVCCSKSAFHSFGPNVAQLGVKTFKPLRFVGFALELLEFIGVLFGCFDRKTDGPGLPGG